MSKHLPDERRSKTALCLSGGGFRATLFHSGALRRLNELGVLSQIDTITSVSGGSIANGLLATAWGQLTEQDGTYTNFDPVIAEPIREFCRADLRTQVLVWDRAKPTNWWKLLGADHSVTDLLAGAYSDLLGLGTRLDSVAPSRTFIFCASNLETGANWEFEIGPNGVAQMGDYKTGKTAPSNVTVSQAVAASSAFPIAFPPLVLRFNDPTVFQGGIPEVTLESKKQILLTDGGVYDNLGLEPVWKSHKYLMASDAGAPFELKDSPGKDFVRRLLRSQGLIDNQSRALRKRWLVSMFIQKVMTGAYWGITSDHKDYQLNGSQGFEDDLLELLGDIRTDLNAFTEAEIACLENHGYAISDTAARRWLTDGLALKNAPFAWPHAGFTPADRTQVVKALKDSGARGIMSDLWRSALDRLRL